MKLVLQIAIPIILWLFLAWFCSDGGKDKGDLWYVILLPFILTGVVSIIAGIAFFMSWLY